MTKEHGINGKANGVLIDTNKDNIFNVLTSISMAITKFPLRTSHNGLWDYCSKHQNTRYGKVTTTTRYGEVENSDTPNLYKFM